MNNWCCILWPSALGNLVLHRLGEPVIHSHHILPRRASVHIVVVILRRRFRRSRFGLRNHRFCGGLVLTSSRGGRRRGHPSCPSPGVLRGTVCGLLLLYGGLAVALTIDAFSRFYSAGFGGSPTACAPAFHIRNTRCCRTDDSAPLSHQQLWHFRVSRAHQQHFPEASSPQQPLT